MLCKSALLALKQSTVLKVLSVIATPAVRRKAVKWSYPEFGIVFSAKSLPVMTKKYNKNKNSSKKSK